ncbi:MAG: hypothetical protein AAGG07_12240 [Planctomycetota bacterium]
MDTAPPIILLARMDSKRLPGKALADVCGRPLLTRVVERLRCVRDRVPSPAGPIVLATTSRSVDDAVEAWALKEGVGIHRSERPTDDVAGRFLDAARIDGASVGGHVWAFRVNGDSPLVDPGLLAAAAELVRPGVDLVTNLVPRRFPYGVAVELVRLEVLASRLQHAAPEDREHVTRILYRELPLDRIASVPGGDPGWASLRATVDAAEDLERFRAFVEAEGERWPITPLRAVLAWARGGSPA